jgi:protein-S-isoprenylcysteine O-methyltransferase Ste14
MWIPTPIYESLPYAYIVVGVLFISGTLYVGLNHPAAPLYITCGLFSIIVGAAVFAKRQAHRRGITVTKSDDGHTA